MRDVFLNQIIKAAKRNKNIVFLTADLGYGYVERFKDEFPERFFNVGISEQNMMSVAAGLALEGKKVFVYSIGNFNTQRCLEQIRNDVCFLNLDVNIISMGAGLEYSWLGFTHFLTEDIACLRCLPNLSIFSPANDRETTLAAREMLKSKTPCYIRLNKKGAPYKSELKTLKLNEVCGGKDFAIVATGRIIDEALKAREILKKQRIDIAVFSMPKLSKFDKSEVRSILSEFKIIFTLEEHVLIGGLSEVLGRVLSGEGNHSKIYNFGLRNAYYGLVGKREFMLKSNKIDANSLAKSMKNVIKREYGNKKGAFFKK